MSNITTDDFVSWLEKFINFERWPQKAILNLKSMYFYATHFGNPQNAYKSIHVAGSKGKGSISIMLSSVLKEIGAKCGLYTSPHVEDFRERITEAGTFFSEQAYSRNYKKIMDGIEELLKKDASLDPTWFELVTLLAFVLFRDEGCDWAVFETGMGGRLDTTNILLPACSVITPIELEHCQYLGDTKEKIASEKAGIIKMQRPVFCFDQEEAPLKVFRDKAKEMDAPFFYMPDIVSNIKAKPTLDGLDVEIEFGSNNEIGKLFSRHIRCRLAFIDMVQAKNAALVSIVAKYLFASRVTEEDIENGLAKAWLPARFEVFSKTPLVVLDGAHTEKSIEYCVETYKKLLSQKAIVLFACADDKNTKLISPIFRDIAKKIYITIPGTFKKSNIEKAKADFEAFYRERSIECFSSSDYQGMIEKAFLEAKKDDVPLLITGSFYLVAEAKKIMSHL